jgi:hypothetical protein
MSAARGIGWYHTINWYGHMVPMVWYTYDTPGASKKRGKTFTQQLLFLGKKDIAIWTI